MIRRLPLICASLLVSTFARADEQPSVALLLVTPGPGVVAGELKPVEAALVKELGLSAQLHVMPRAQAEAALDVPHRKQLAKCKKDAACLSKVAGFVQADMAGTLEVAHVAKGTSVTLTVIAVKTERELARIQKTFKAKPDLPALAKAIADETVAAVTASPEFGVPPPPLRTTRMQATAAPEEPQAVAPPPAAPRKQQAASKEPEEQVEAEEPAPAPVKKRARREAEEDEQKALARTSSPGESTPSQPTRTSNGFVLGFDFGYGLWGADPEKIVAGMAADAQFVEDATAQSTARAFTAPLDKQWRPDINLHLGWNILGYGSIEGVFQMSWWDLFITDRGGTGLIGGRATIYPLQFFMPNRNFDIGLEGGGGYSIVGGPTYGMDGSYAEFGVTGEYYLGRNISIGLFYRLFLPMWNRFYVDYNNHIDFAVKDFSASWNTLGLALNFHVSP